MGDSLVSRRSTCHDVVGDDLLKTSMFKELDLDNGSDESERAAIIQEVLDIFGFEPAHDVVDPVSFEDSVLCAWATEDAVHDGHNTCGHRHTMSQVGNAVCGMGDSLVSFPFEQYVSKMERRTFPDVVGDDLLKTNMLDGMWLGTSVNMGTEAHTPASAVTADSLGTGLCAHTPFVGGTILRKGSGMHPEELVNDTNSPRYGRVAPKVARGAAFAAVAALRALGDADRNQAENPILPTPPMGKPSGRPVPKRLLRR